MMHYLISAFKDLKTTLIGFALLIVAGIGKHYEWFDNGTIAMIATTALGFFAAGGKRKSSDTDKPIE